MSNPCFGDSFGCTTSLVSNLLFCSPRISLKVWPWQVLPNNRKVKFAFLNYWLNKNYTFLGEEGVAEAARQHLLVLGLHCPADNHMLIKRNIPIGRSAQDLMVNMETITFPRRELDKEMADWGSRYCAVAEVLQSSQYISFIGLLKSRKVHRLLLFQTKHPRFRAPRHECRKNDHFSSPKFRWPYHVNSNSAAHHKFVGLIYNLQHERKLQSPQQTTMLCQLGAP